MIDEIRRGLGAVRELKKGELVLKVPRNALLTTESMVAKDWKVNDAVNLHGSLSSTKVLFFICPFECVLFLYLRESKKIQNC